jgi:3',5'-cyclic AMP phosphodiesterase CpdA
LLSRPLAAALTGLVSLLVVGLAPSAGQAAPTPERVQARASAVSVVAVGDIACPPDSARTKTTCHQADTASLAASLSPYRVLALGDLQYDDGNYQAFMNSYDHSWGALKDITYPLPGNHEYKTAGAAGYYSYFAYRPATQPPGYYRKQIGAWQVYLLNSNCSNIDCSREYTWLQNSLDANPSTCTLFATHHPRYSSGEHGSSTAMSRFFRIAYRHHVELFLSGHDHHYERFRPMDADGNRTSDGVVQMISGTGGKSLYPLGPLRPGSAFAKSNRFGVLKLTLRSGSYDFAYRTVAGATPDSGSRTCR